MLRLLTECERTITTSLLTDAGVKAENFHSQAEILVKVLDDGSMGSLEFLASPRLNGELKSGAGSVSSEGNKVKVEVTAVLVKFAVEVDAEKIK